MTNPEFAAQNAEKILRWAREERMPEFVALVRQGAEIMAEEFADMLYGQVRSLERNAFKMRQIESLMEDLLQLDITVKPKHVPWYRRMWRK